MPWPPSDPKNVKQNQAVFAIAKLVFREYSWFALDFNFPVKKTLVAQTTCWLKSGLDSLVKVKKLLCS